MRDKKKTEDGDDDPGVLGDVLSTASDHRLPQMIASDHG